MRKRRFLRTGGRRTSITYLSSVTEEAPSEPCGDKWLFWNQIERKEQRNPFADRSVGQCLWKYKTCLAWGPNGESVGINEPERGEGGEGRCAGRGM